MTAEDPKLAFLGRDTLVYEENSRQIDATIDWGERTVVLFQVSIGRWRDDPMTTISDSERARIIDRIKQLLERKGLTLQVK